MLTAISLLAATAASSPRNVPANAVNVTLYHEFAPRWESLGLANQDTGDVRGDAYFVLRSLILPVECAPGANGNRFDCDNEEANSTHNVVTRNTVLVDSSFGTYASCNAGPTGYSCTGPTTKTGDVGRCDVKAREVGHPHPRAGAKAWEWWRLNLAVKMGTPIPAYWYSTVAAGDCATAAPGQPCHWKLLATTRRIVAACLGARVFSAVRRHAGEGCFTACPQPQNISSTCVPPRASAATTTQVHVIVLLSEPRKQSLRIPIHSYVPIARIDLCA